MHRSVIILYIDPEAYKQETGKNLSKAELERQGKHVNEDAAGMFGYEGWETRLIVDMPFTTKQVESRRLNLNFGNDAIDSYVRSLNQLQGYRIEGDWENDGFPADCFIVEADDDGLKICEDDGEGHPLFNSTWVVPYDEIKSIKVL